MKISHSANAFSVVFHYFLARVNIESWHWVCLYCIPKVFLATSGGCFLSVYLDSQVGLSQTKQRVRSCPCFLALFGLVPKQHEGVLSHRAEWEWQRAGINSPFCAVNHFCMSWGGKKKPNKRDICFIFFLHRYLPRELKILKNGSTYVQVSCRNLHFPSVCDLFCKQR